MESFGGETFQKLKTWEAVELQVRRGWSEYWKLFVVLNIIDQLSSPAEPNIR